MRKDYGRRKHMDWRFFFVWLVQTFAAIGFFLIALGAFVLCGWGIPSHLGWVPSPEGVPSLQSLELYVHGHRVYYYAQMAVACFRTLCSNGYAPCVILWLILFLVLIEALSVLLNRLAAACEIRRYNT